MSRLRPRITAVVAWLLVVTGLPADPLSEALAGKYRGTLVRVAGPRSDGGPSSWDSFSSKTGIVVRFEAWDDFEATLVDRIGRGLPPDIAEVRRPGLVESLAKKGRILDWSPVVDRGWVLGQIPAPWVDLATFSGPRAPILAGVWGRVELLAQVWYPRLAFERAGYRVPDTWADLLRLQDRMRRDGVAPWTLALTDRETPGSSASAWVEALLVRVASPTTFDRWERGQLKPLAPEVAKAAQAALDLWLTPGNVPGGPQALFGQPPGAWMFLGGGALLGRVPPSLVPGTDIDAFPLPPIDPRYGRPVLVTASLYVPLVDRPEVRATLQYLATGESTQTWVQGGRGLSPLRDVDLQGYPDPVTRRMAQSLGQAGVVRWVDPGSPPWKAVLEKELTEVAAGRKSLDGALRAAAVTSGR